ncbi:hypothetical protein EYF80_003554 [Liparis tanakae]|uniref:Uncharacterized protein n=1 Tax=Liparis tanakae TaxID=230148 RepID=A0A4Z2J7Z5_9TELE|nr:hypothetical protein EYF80_003554 [Liparis tanakae]
MSKIIIPSPLTIVSTMLGLELRSVLAAKNTSTMLWCRIISRIMVLAQKVPLRPPPFLRPGEKKKESMKDADTNTEEEKHERPHKDVEEQAASRRGRRRVKCHSLTERRSSTPSGGEKANRRDFHDEYGRKDLIKIQKREVNQM